MGRVAIQRRTLRAARGLANRTNGSLGCSALTSGIARHGACAPGGLRKHPGRAVGTAAGREKKYQGGGVDPDSCAGHHCFCSLYDASGAELGSQFGQFPSAGGVIGGANPLFMELAGSGGSALRVGRLAVFGRVFELWLLFSSRRQMRRESREAVLGWDPEAKQRGGVEPRAEGASAGGSADHATLLGS